MQIQENISLKPYNSFGIDVRARQFATFNGIEELAELIEASENQPKFILGGGSNILLTKNYDGIVLKNEVKGIHKIAEDDEFVYIRAGAGENWHSFVLTCIQNNWCGVENLSLIPGNIGASPMQNIGAYGVEIKDVFHELEAYHIHDHVSRKFSLSECNFGYRESIFKQQYRDQFVILQVTYRLRKQARINTSYGAIEQELEKMGVVSPTIKNVSDAVIFIRSSKLPDPNVIGNAGSFFKNPSVTAEKFAQLKSKFPAIIGYENPNGTVKLAAGWLIEQCGWKGYRKGDAGCHAKQALVLVNYGNAHGSEIDELAGEIITSVFEKFSVALEKEVNII